MAHAQLNKVLRQVCNLGETQTLAEASDAQLLQRFICRHEEAAFAALVRRHGPMVLSVSERVLHRVQDAEDVFQATFLVLARKAGSIRNRAALGSWLHGVAHRLSVRARAQGARRQIRERRAADMRTTQPGPDVSWSEARAVLDTAIADLPEKYRTVVLLCCLQGRAHAEVAQLLDCPLATVRTRLTRGRALLRDRLARRGLTLSAAGLAALLVASAARATVPATLLQATLRAGLPFAAGQPAATLCSAPVAVLVEGGLKATAFTKTKAAMAMLLTAGLLLGTGAFAHRGLLADDGPSSPGAPQEADGRATRFAPPVAADRTADVIEVRGRVLDPDGRPFAGAKVYLNYEPARARATSGADGRFSFSFPRALLGPSDADGFWFQVIAMAEGYGPGWVSQNQPVTSLEPVLRLVPDLPLQGRILDLNGKPVAGATLRIEQTIAYVNPDAFLQTVRDRDWPLVDGNAWSGPFPGQPTRVTTGTDGRFRLTGFGRDRVVAFQLEGPGIQYGEVRAVVREMKAPVEPRKLKPPASGPNLTRVYGATFDHAALPSRPIRGVVRDKKTRRPIAGVEVRAFGTTHRTRSDAQGRYELLGCPKNAEGYGVYVSPTGLPYFSTSVQLPDTAGLGPVSGDIELKGGILAQGRVTHAVTGKPISGARIHYNPLYPNPFVRLLGPNGAGSVPASWAETGPDGTYRLVVLPGPGALGFLARSPGETFMPVLVTARDLKIFFGDNDFHGNEDMLRLQAGVNSWSAVGQDQFNELLLLRPTENDATLTRDVALRPARPLRGTVVGSDGKPLAEVRAYNLAPSIVFHRLTDGTFTVQGLNPRRRCPLVFLDKDRRYGAFVSLIGEQKEPLAVRLQPCGTVTGRLLDTDGEPVAGAVVRLEPDVLSDAAPARVKTDAAGRFRIVGLVPGLKHQARLGLPPFGQYLYQPFTVKAGQTRDLGDVQVKSVR